MVLGKAGVHLALMPIGEQGPSVFLPISGSSKQRCICEGSIWVEGLAIMRHGR